MNWRFTATLALIFIAFTLLAQEAAAGQGAPQRQRQEVNNRSQVGDALDFNEETHLVFMREEEKLARDVYTTLGMMYPDSSVFGRIDDSEQRHTEAVREMLENYGIEDPSTNDNNGVFTGEDYGTYFEEKYTELVSQAASGELSALYVGALIEELDMLDIHRCPEVILSQDNGIDSEELCGLDYTDKQDIQRLYESLLEGSANHLRGYVSAIEAIIGEGANVPQLLDAASYEAIVRQ
ncbi:MAG: DUF2202 domain-containing protein [Candidatus Thiodiazotropha sp.]